jgi:hypothetical protein
MSETSEPCRQTSLWDSLSATSSPASAAGPTPCASQAGTTSAPSGREAARASRSPRRDAAKDSTTRGISGPRGAPSFASADLSRSLGNRLRRQLEGHGSTLFRLTWKRSATPLGRPFFRLVASALRTSEAGFGSWATPRASDSDGGIWERESTGQDLRTQASWATPQAHDARGPKSPEAIARQREAGAGVVNLNEQARLAAWPTPTCGNADGSQMAKDASPTGKRPDGSKATVSLNAVARLASWPTPVSNDAKGSTHCYAQGDPTRPVLKLPGAARLASWPTPTANEMRTESREQLEARRARCKESTGNGNGFGLTLGNAMTLWIAETDTPGSLNPAHSRWLQGYPATWDACAPTATRSSRK